MYRRFQGAVPNARGTFPGVFALANGLLRGGLLTPADDAWVRRENAAAELAYPDPSTVDPTCYDPVLHPGARSWFRDGATELLAATQGYLDLLDRHGVPGTELRTTSPGRVVYADAVQVVAVPGTHPDDWVLGAPPSGE